MHQDDQRSLKHFFAGILWLFLSTITLFIVTVGYLVLFPIQLVLWLFGDKSFSKTGPYQYLAYIFEKGSRFPGEEFPPSYKDWEKKK